jgi:hypothetical protein
MRSSQQKQKTHSPFLAVGTGAYRIRLAQVPQPEARMAVAVVLISSRTAIEFWPDLNIKLLLYLNIHFLLP